jgi:hypothetical protein
MNWNNSVHAVIGCGLDEFSSQQKQVFLSLLRHSD